MPFKPSLRSQSGIAQVLTLLGLLAILAVILFIGYRIYENRPVDELTSDTATDTSQTTVPEVTSAGDLDKASTTLDQIDTDSTDQTDASTLDAELDKF